MAQKDKKNAGSNPLVVDAQPNVSLEIQDIT